MIKLTHLSSKEVKLIDLDKGYTLKDYAAEIKEFCGADINKVRFICEEAKQVDPSNTDLRGCAKKIVSRKVFQLGKGNLLDPFEFKPKKIVSKPLHFVIMKNKKVYDRITMKKATNVTMMYGVYRFLCKSIKGSWSSLVMHIDKYDSTPELLRDEKLSLKNGHYKFLSYEVGFFIMDSNIIVTIDDKWYQQFDISKGILTTVVLEVAYNSELKLMNIFIHSPFTHPLIVFCTLDVTVEQLRKEVAFMFDLTHDDVRLLFCGKHLYGDNSLSSNYICKDTKLYMTRRLRGGGGSPGMEFVDVTKGLTETRNWSSSAPKWRIVNNGLVLEGKCKNSRCVANNRMICCSFGFGRFDIINERYKVVCPMCKQYVKPELPGFNNCSYTIIGVKEDSIIPSKWSSKALDAYTVFSKATSGKAIFTRLEIITNPLRYGEENFDSSVEQICAICNQKLIPEEATQAECSEHYFHKDCFMSGNNGEPFDYCPKCE